jgi:hypothetical protein
MYSRPRLEGRGEIQSKEVSVIDEVVVVVNTSGHPTANATAALRVIRVQLLGKTCSLRPFSLFG